TGLQCRYSNRSRMRLPAKKLEANSNYWSISRISPGAKVTPRMSMRALSCPKRRPSVNSFGAGSLEAADTIFWLRIRGLQKKADFLAKMHLAGDSRPFFEQDFRSLFPPMANLNESKEE